MANQWFRMYSAAIDDEALRLLAFEDRWHFVALLCCKSSGLIDKETDPSMLRRKLAVKLGLDMRALDEVERRLKEVGLLGEGFNPTNWDKLQYVSDSSTARVAAYREKKKRECNVSETPPETETETETEAEGTPLPPDAVDDKFLEFWSAYPKKVGKEAARKVWVKIKKPAESLDAILTALAWQSKSAQWTKNQGQFIPNPSTYLSQQRWLDEPPVVTTPKLTAVGQKSASAANRWLDSQGFQLEKTA